MLNNASVIDEDIDILNSLNAEFIISVFDVEGHMSYANTNFYKVFDAGAKEFKVTTLLKSLTVSDREYWEVCKTIFAGFKWQGILYFKDITDRTYCLETTISPIKNDVGIVEKYIAFSNDVASAYCKQVDSSSIYNDEKRLLETNTKQALYITKQGKIFNSYQAGPENSFVGFIGSNIFDYINPVNHAYLNTQIQKVFAKGKTCTYQSMGFSAKGSQKCFVTKIKPVFNLQGEVIYAAVKSKKHITGIKANKQLKSIETKYTNIFQSINVGIIVVANANGIIIEWNKGAERAFGYSDVEIIGEHLSLIVSQKDLDKNIQELLKVKDKLDKDLSSPNVQMVGLKKDGKEFPVEFAMSRWQNGKEQFYCAVMIDMTKHKKLESKLKKTTEDLELFLYRAAHDLKAPLTSAEGLLHLLKDEPLTENAKQLLDMVDETLGKGKMLLDDLELASIISEKSRTVTTVDFKEKVGMAMCAIKGMDDFKHIKFHIDVHQESDFLFNLELLDFVLQTLLRNVVGFIRPKCEGHCPEAWIAITVADDSVKIKISDNGLGIKKKYLDKVFDLYFSLYKNESHSTGLELYIVKRIVEEFHGEITVKSEVNQGTSFEVILPNLKEGNLNYD